MTNRNSEQLAIIENWAERVWAQQDASAIDELFEDDGIAGGLGRKDLAGPPEFREFHQAMCALLKDTWLEVGEFMEQGDKLACLARFGGTSRDTGEKVEIEGSMYIEFRNGHILHCANHFEFMHLFEQLGLMPQDSFVRAMGKGALAPA